QQKAPLSALRDFAFRRQLPASVRIGMAAIFHTPWVNMWRPPYPRHIASHSDEIARRALLETNAQPPAAANVVPLSKGRWSWRSAGSSYRSTARVGFQSPRHTGRSYLSWAAGTWRRKI